MAATDVRDPNRLFPVDPATRDVARALYASVAAAPVVSPHGYVRASVLANNAPFSNPADLLVTSDQRVTRLLHANGVRVEQLGLGRADVDPREVWRIFAEHWHVFAGT